MIDCRRCSSRNRKADGSCRNCGEPSPSADTLEGMVPLAPAPSVVDHPGHYTAGKVECIDALEAATVNLTGIEAVCTANAIKYLWRWKLKNGAEDLKKARWYLDRLIARVEGK